MEAFLFVVAVCELVHFVRPMVMALFGGGS